MYASHLIQENIRSDRNITHQSVVLTCILYNSCTSMSIFNTIFRDLYNFQTFHSGNPQISLIASLKSLCIPAHTIVKYARFSSNLHILQNLLSQSGAFISVSGF